MNPMTKNKSRFTLLENEKVVLSTSKHWIKSVGPALACLICTLLLSIRVEDMNTSYLLAVLPEIAPYMAGIPQEILSWTGMLLLVLADAKAIAKMATAMLTRYYITDKRIIILKGVVTIRFSEMALVRCETVTMKQNILERILGSGDLYVISAGTSLLLNDVPRAISFRALVMDLMTRQMEDTTKIQKP